MKKEPHMKMKYDNGHSKRIIPLLDVHKAKSLSPKSAELRLVNNDVTFQVLLPEGHVDAWPIELASLKKQPTAAEIFARFAPVNMSVLNAELIDKLKKELKPAPGTMLHAFLCEDHTAHERFEYGVCRITFRNGERRDCYIYVRPTTDDERAKAMQRAEARRLAPEDQEPTRKRGKGPGRRPSYTPRELECVEVSIREHGGSIGAAAQALSKEVSEIRRMHDAYRHRQRNLNVDLRARK